MSVYNWELSARAQRQQALTSAGKKKAKPTGLVVLHADATVDCRFERLLREHVVPARLRTRYGDGGLVKHDDEDNKNNDNNDADNDDNDHNYSSSTTIRTPLMQQSTADVLRTHMGFDALLPCQAQCYRGIFLGRDVILHSHTGSGKTLAYALPIIERHLLLERRAETPTTAAAASAHDDDDDDDAHKSNNKKRKTHKARDRATTTAATAATRVVHAPFLLVFVFSNDLAIQTRDVLSTLYPQLRIAVAGVDVRPTHSTNDNDDDTPQSNTTTTTTTSKDERGVDVLVGTLPHIDQLIRGERTRTDTMTDTTTTTTTTRGARDTRKRTRDDASTQQTTRKKARRDARNDNNDNNNNNDDDDHVAGACGVVSAARVRAIVIDEVDLTLGPRFSAVGRRIKHLLHAIRVANRSLVDGVLGECRRHHYVLCGATIPDWVLRAGFLGVKKYHYALVGVGTRKLPSTLQCLQLRCDAGEARVRTAVALLTSHRTHCALGRTVVFGSAKQIRALEEALTQAATSAATAAAATSVQQQQQQEHDDKHNKGSNTTTTTRSSSSKKADKTAATTTPVVRTMLACKSEAERVAALRAFNRGVANTMLCTDVAARGLDFVAVDTVVMLSLPAAAHMAVETFVHRAGRTARVGRRGRCLLLCDDSERDRVDGICKTAHVTFASFALPCDNDSNNNNNKTTAGARVTRLVLTVRNAFAYSTSSTPTSSSSATAATATTSPPPPRRRRAHDVLRRQLDATLYAQLRDVADVDDSGEVVAFVVDAAVVPQVRAALWKYNLREERDA